MSRGDMGKNELRSFYVPLYHPYVKRYDLPRISPQVREHIKRFIETKLIRAPEFYGTPLRSTLNLYWKQCLGIYRVIYKIRNNKLIILAIKSSKELYKQYDIYLNHNEHKKALLQYLKDKRGFYVVKGLRDLEKGLGHKTSPEEGSSQGKDRKPQA